MIVPTYNERNNIDELVARIGRACSEAGIEAETVVVDDNSPDGTGVRAEELAKSHRIKVVHRAGKLGLSSAVIDGFKVASGSILVVMDADLSHPPEKIPEMVAKLETGEADLVVGSRHVKGGSIENWTVRRRIMSKGAKLLARGLTKVKDPMSGFFALKPSVIEGVALNPIGYKIGLEILVKGKYSKVVELPIGFVDRKAGKSKLGGSEMMKYIDHVTQLYEHKRPWLARYIKFALVGGIGTVINVILYWAAIEFFGVHYLWAATLAFVVAATSNYALNRFWTFKSKGRLHVQYSQFLIVSINGYMLNLILLETMVSSVLPSFGIGDSKSSLLLVLAQVVAIFSVSVFNFFANSLWTFRDEMRGIK